MENLNVLIGAGFIIWGIYNLAVNENRLLSKIMIIIGTFVIIWLK